MPVRRTYGSVVLATIEASTSRQAACPKQAAQDGDVRPASRARRTFVSMEVFPRARPIRGRGSLWRVSPGAALRLGSANMRRVDFAGSRSTSLVEQTFRPAESGSRAVNRDKEA
jgi:hypothetical protein